MLCHPHKKKDDTVKTGRKQKKPSKQSEFIKTTESETHDESDKNIQIFVDSNRATHASAFRQQRSSRSQSFFAFVVGGRSTRLVSLAAAWCNRG